MYFNVMNQSKRLLHTRKFALIASFTAISLMMTASYFYAYGQDKIWFPRWLRCRASCPA